MNLVDALLGEHAALRTLFTHVERYAPSWDLRICKQTGLLLESMLGTHSILEDQLLFDLLRDGQGIGGEVLESMREEHKAMASELEQLRAAVSVAAGAGRRDRQRALRD